MRIYFSGIGGVGIGPLAEIAADANYEALGSDRAPSLLTEQLEERSVAITYQQDGVFLQAAHDERPIDKLIYTAALTNDHPEIVLARQLGIPLMKRDEFLEMFIQEKQLKLVAIAGTHGKTSTTSMMVWAMQQLGIPISYSVGSKISFGPSGSYSPESEYFIYECDEFDRNFLSFKPHLSLITSIDYDHPDTYITKDLYIDAFCQFLLQSDFSILWKPDAEALGTVPDKSWILGDHDNYPEITLPGEHVRRNASLIVKSFERLGLTGDVIEKINTFPGASRRFEKLADNLYTDYAHHPREIKATLQLVSEVSDSVVVVYQPHQNVRQHEIYDQYTDEVFSQADYVYWLPTYLSREDEHQRTLTPKDLTARLKTTKFAYSKLDDTLWEAINQHRQSGSLVICMGAGDIDSWLRNRVAS